MVSGACHRVLHHCVVTFFWSTKIMDCFLFWFANRVTLMHYGVSVKWHFAFSLMNNFNKTKLLFFQRKLCFLWTFVIIT